MSGTRIVFHDKGLTVADGEGKVARLESPEAGTLSLIVDVERAVFLSGPVTDMPGNNREAFAEAAAELERRGCHVFNPTEAVPAGATHEQAMAICVRALAANVGGRPLFDMVAQLPGWYGSRGAYAEAIVADALGIHCAPLRIILAELDGEVEPNEAVHAPGDKATA